MKLSFKKHPRETGLRAVGNGNPFVDIKGDGRVVGWISPKNHNTTHYTIWFHVKHPDDVGGFYNVSLRNKCDTEQEAREYIKRYWTIIQEKLTLHQLED